MPLERENFYILLELEFDPPVLDPGKIKLALRQKKQEWTRWQDNPGKRNLALTNLGLASEIERVMLDPVLRADEAAAAVEKRAGIMRQFEAELRILEGKGHVLPREANAIAVKYRAWGVTRESVEAAARCPISETPPETTEDETAGKVLDRVTARAIQRNLELLGCEDLYAFLGEPPYSSVKKLCDAAEQRRRAAASAGARSSEGSIAQELAGVCLQLFADFDSKQTYDRYLKIGRFSALCDMIDEEFARAKVLTPASVLRLVNFGVERHGLGVLEAEDLVRRYAAAYNIPLSERAKTIPCPACGNKTDREGAACSVCAQPLRGECPGCGAPFEGGPAACSACGFPIKEMVKALHNIGEAENALIESNWSTASRCLAYADKYWPGHPKLETLKRRALLLEERYAHYVDTIADCVAHNQYYAALDLVREAAARRLPLPPATVEHVEQVVLGLEEKLAAIRQRAEEPSYEELARMTETVSDSMELTHLMRRYPPEAPGRLLAAVHERHVRLTWHVSESAGMKEYIVVRRQEEVPLTAYDGDIVYEGPANSFLDKTAQPLCEYHYAVYTRRGGAVSSGAATAGPFIIVPEVRKLRILPVDQGAQLSWEYEPGVKDVLIWRKLGGERPTGPKDGILLENVRLDGFTDSRMKNGVDYWYYVVCVYVVGGRAIASRGVCEGITPRQIHAPIEDLVVTRTDSDEEDEYVASWQGSSFSDVLLFVSHRKPACRKGETFLLSDLVEQYHKLVLDAKQPQSARFRYSWSGGIYLFPVAVSGRFATVGEIRYLANVHDVQDPTFDRIEKDIYVNMKWPPGLTEIAVCWRHDRFAKSPAENGATLLRYTREQYDYDAGVRIPEAERTVYYVTIFSIFLTPEGERVYSKGVNLLVNNAAKTEAFYEFRRARKFFGQTSRITVTIQSEEAFVLPRSLIVGKVGRLPLGKNDGTALFEIERDTRVEGSVTYEYRTSSLPDDLYIRLFLQDEKRYDKLRLLPVGKLKIT